MGGRGAYLGLCDLVVVVREGQVDTARVDIELVAKQLAAAISIVRVWPCPRMRPRFGGPGRDPPTDTHLAIAEHSMCHPGRPLPHGESHAGSPGRDAFHRAKSHGARFSLKPKLMAPEVRAGGVRMRGGP